MSRHFGWAMMIAVGIMLGYGLGSHQPSHAAAQAEPQAGDEAGGGNASTENANTEIMQQLKEVNSHLKRIDSLLYSGRLRVVQVINPGASG